jgi:hypothetical protein
LDSCDRVRSLGLPAGGPARPARLGKCRSIVENLIKDLEDRAFAEIPLIEKSSLDLYAQNPEKARAFLTAYCRDFALAATQRYWDLGDELWDAFVFGFYLSPEERRKWR